MKIIINDYGCHPFTLQLAKSLAQKKHIVNYMFPTYLQNPIANFKDYRSCKNLFINPIQIKGTYNKYNFFLRRKQEIEYGNISWKKIKNIKAKVLICVTVPLDALRILVKEAKNIEIPLIFWVQDIYSEAIKKILLKKFFLLSGIISWYYSKIENYCIQNSSKIIFITHKFKKYFKNLNYSKYIVIENWGVLQNKIKNNLKHKWKKRLKLKNEFIFLYAGTLSYKHDSQLFLKLSEEFKDSKVIIFSEGKFAEILKKQSKNYKNLIVKNWVDFNELQSVFGLADVLLVSLSKDASEFSVPSKILNYFYSGKPILGMMPKQNLASKKILKLKCGYIAEPDNFNIFLNKAQKLYKSKTLRKKMGLNALNYAKKYFDIEAITNKFENIFINSQN